MCIYVVWLLFDEEVVYGLSVMISFCNSEMIEGEMMQLSRTEREVESELDANLIQILLCKSTHKPKNRSKKSGGKSIKQKNQSVKFVQNHCSTLSTEKVGDFWSFANICWCNLLALLKHCLSYGNNAGERRGREKKEKWRKIDCAGFAG